MKTEKSYLQMELENYEHIFHIFLKTHLVLRQVYNSLLDAQISSYIKVLPMLFLPHLKKNCFPMSLFIILHFQCESSMLADNFPNFGGTVSGTVAFLMFMFFSNLFVSDFGFRHLKISFNFRFFLISRILWCFCIF